VLGVLLSIVLPLGTHAGGVAVLSKILLPLLGHAVLEAGALVILGALGASIGWARLLGCGQLLVERTMREIGDAWTRDDRCEAPPDLDRVLRRERAPDPDGIVEQLRRALVDAPCGPPSRLFLDADPAVRELYLIRAEVPESP
jgi:hypothetical protein